MSEHDKLGVTTETAMIAAIPIDGGLWKRQPLTCYFVDGHLHKIVMPGFEVRSAESFGITATFHTFNPDSSGKFNVVQMNFQDGRAAVIKTVATDVLMTA
jgi:hypothetical protein